MQVDLEGRVALVTGAARGIGKGVADLLARNGARVVYTDLDGAAAAAGTEGVALPFDVRRTGEAERVAAEVAARFGRVDILVNNAGIGTRAEERADVDGVADEVWHRILETDLTGVFLTTRAFARGMIAAGFGRIVNVASVVGLVPLRRQSAYAAAKAGVVNLTRASAIELAPHGILVNAVAPGATATESWQAWLDDPASREDNLYGRLLSHVPLGRPASVEEVAAAVLYLAAPENTYVTGHTLVVDGGWTAGFARDF